MMSISLKRKMNQWQAVQSARQMEQDRLNFLRNSPLPQTPPHLMIETKVRCQRPFFIAGKRIEIGQIIGVEYHVAMDMAAIGKCEIITEL